MIEFYLTLSLSEHLLRAKTFFRKNLRIQSLSMRGGAGAPFVSAIYVEGTGPKQSAHACDGHDLDAVLAKLALSQQYPIAIAGTGRHEASYKVTFVTEQISDGRLPFVSPWQLYSEIFDDTDALPLLGGTLFQAVQQRASCRGIILTSYNTNLTDVRLRALWRPVATAVPLEGLNHNPDDVPGTQLEQAIDVMRARRARLRATYMFGGPFDFGRLLLWSDPLVEQGYALGVTLEEARARIAGARKERFELHSVSSIGMPNPPPPNTPAAPPGVGGDEPLLGSTAPIFAGERFDLIFIDTRAPSPVRSFSKSPSLLDAAGSAAFAPIDACIEGFMKDHSIRAMQFAVAHFGKLKYARAYRWAEPSYPDVHLLQKIGMGSVTKSVTATAIMMLLERGLLPNGLKSSVKEILRESNTPLSDFSNPRVPATDPRFAELTVDHLLCHASAFSDEGGNQTDQSFAPVFLAATGKASVRRPISPAQSMGYYALINGDAFDGTNRPGSVIEYHNMNFVILGRIIEAVIGNTASYLDWIRDNIFAPIGVPRPRVALLSHTPGNNDEAQYSMCAPTPGPDWAHSNANPEAMAYEAYIGNSRAYDAHGALSMSIVDLIRFMTSLDLGPDKEPTLITRATRDKVLWSFPENLVSARGYASDNRRGWYNEPLGSRGRSWNEHDGATGGSGAIAGVRDDGVAFGVLHATTCADAGFYAFDQCYFVSDALDDIISTWVGWASTDLFT